MGGKLSKKKKSPEERKADKNASKMSTAIDHEMFKDHLEDRRVIKLLLLGAGESGKSTLFKQTIQLYGKGFDKASMDSYLQIIHRNILQSMAMIVKWSDKLHNEQLQTRISAEASAAKEYFLSLKPTAISDGKVDEKAAEHIKTLWADPGIRLTFDHRSKFQIPDSASYFFGEVDRIAAPDYSPNYEDILRCRSRTTGIVETGFQIKNDFFKIMDVGGQRSERKKWIHCFEDVTAVIFVAAINEYDQTLYEDNTTNRMVEALDLFDKTCNSKWFQSASIILFLNKRDLFEDKIKRVDLSVCFPDYKGGCNYENGCDYLMEKFKAQNKQPGVKIFGHITCATDTDNVKFTFNSVKKIVISSSLKRSGLA